MTRHLSSAAPRRLAITVLATGVLLAGLAGAPGPAGAHSPNPVFAGGLFAQNADLRFRWGTGGTPPTVMRTAVTNAAAGSNASRKSKAPTFTYDAGGNNTVYYGVDVPCGINGLACFRRDAPTWFGIWIRENGHRYCTVRTLAFPLTQGNHDGTGIWVPSQVFGSGHYDRNER